MTLHLLKLAVGAQSVDDLRVRNEGRSEGAMRLSRITTRMAPKRADEIVGVGSLYWVVKGVVAARQVVHAIEPFKDSSGVSRVWIMLRPEVTTVRPRPCRPFQGWRYLRAEDAPEDWDLGAIDAAMPPAMRRELAELCLI